MSTKKPISKTKYATTILVKCKTPPLSMEEVFGLIFFKSVDLAHKAKKFHDQLVKSGGILDSDWMKITESMSLDRGSYYHMISKLRGIGIIEKREGVWVQTTHFRTWLEQMLRQVAAIEGSNAIITYSKRE